MGCYEISSMVDHFCMSVTSSSSHIAEKPQRYQDLALLLMRDSMLRKQLENFLVLQMSMRKIYKK